jgi:transcriptional regulator with XRE-family HTH domain
MVARQRPVDRGKQRGIALLRTIGNEIRLGRQGLGLSVSAVARSAGISTSELSRIERALAPWVSLVTLAKLCAVVGLDLSARTFAGGAPLRDARHAALLSDFGAGLHATVRWRLEVPLPGHGEQRSWDGVASGPGWRYAAEAEMNPVDGQALLRRLKQKQRDGAVDGVLVLLRDTRQARAFRREFASQLAVEFPIPGSQAMRLLAGGDPPSGNAIIVL